MTWLKFDDRILDHPKFVRAERLAGSTALHLWVGLMSYCKQHRTDGWVPLDMFKRVNGPRGRWRQRALDALLEVGLVELDGDRLHVHDYLDWNPSRKEIEHGRKGSEPPAESDLRSVSAHGESNVSALSAHSQRKVSVKSAHRESNDNGALGVRRLRARSESESESESESIQIPLGPPPTDPSPPAPPAVENKTSHRAGKRICPSNFEPTPAVLKLATELGYSEALERATRPRMIDWSKSKSVARADWQATYRNWLRKDAEERGLKPVKHDAQALWYREQLRKANEPVKNPVPPPPGFEAKGVEAKMQSLFAVRGG
jgi:hypothetical protein